MTNLQTVVTDAGTEFFRGIENALPDLLGAALFLALAYVAIGLITFLLRAALSRLYPSDERLVVDFVVLVATVALWFGAALALLTILGMEGVAASLGTATGFVALGVAYALSDMIADTVAGLYLLRDPDFNPGDSVTTADVTGEVLSVGLRKSRLDVEGDVVVLSNEAVESRWRRET